MFDETGPMGTIQTARALVDARRNRRCLSSFPGDPPQTLREAYVIQQAVVHAHTSSVGGWKVGMVSERERELLGQSRLIGPIFEDSITIAGGTTSEVALIRGGSAAYEAELVFRMRRNVSGQEAVTAEALVDIVEQVRIGLEVLSSPVADLPGGGACAVIADQGFSGGLILGPAIDDWRSIFVTSPNVSVFEGERLEATGDTGAILGGIVSALQFAAAAAATWGRGLRKDDWVSTGALTGAHRIDNDTLVRADFGELGTVTALFELRG